MSTTNTPNLSDAVTLKKPIKRGDTQITQVQVRTPNAGELRGTRLSELLATDYDSHRTLLPRITVPTINGPEIDAMDPSDIVQLSKKVLDFLLPEESPAPASQNA
jgi:hypothetical protein